MSTGWKNGHGKDLTQLRIALNLAALRESVASIDVAAARIALFIEERKSLLIGQVVSNNNHELGDVPPNRIDGCGVRRSDSEHGHVGDALEVGDCALRELIQRLREVLRDLAEFIDRRFLESHVRNLSPTDTLRRVEDARTPAVKQEGASPSGFPVAGLLHAGGDPHTEREHTDQPETDAEPVPERLIHPPGHDKHEQEQGTDEQVPVELHTDDSTPAGRHTGMKQEGAAANG